MENPLSDTAIDHARRLVLGFGDALQQRRKERRVSLRRLSEITGIAHQYLGQIESGTRVPTADEDRALREWLS
jgi:transcriptional regulator with XRE-family HTH domain